MKRLPYLWLTALCLVLAGCGDSSEDSDSSDEATATSPATVAPTTSEAPPPTDDWAEQLLAAFGAYDDERTRLDGQVGMRLGQLQNPTEQDAFDVFADQMTDWADAGDSMTAALPAEVPEAVEPALEATLSAHRDLLAAMREAAAALRAGDPGPYNDLQDGALVTFGTTCADLQFAVVDLDVGLLPCGNPKEEPEIPAFVETATIDTDDEFVTMPAGGYELDYVGPAGFEPFATIALDYDQDLVIRTSPEVVEIAIAPEESRLRIHAAALVANPTQLSSGDIMDFWPIGVDAAGWIDALDDVTVVSTGTGQISGLDARYWDLVSERPDPIAILGDGPDWLPETFLDPGQTVRLWSIDVGGSPLLVTLHPAAGGGLEDSGTELDMLLGGLVLGPI